MPELTALEIVAATPPDIDVADVAAEVRAQFGLAGDYTPLVSERDQNFRLVTPEGGRFVVKVTSAVENDVVSDFHVATLLHLEEQGGAPAPTVIRTTAGKAAGRIECNGQPTMLRVVTWLDGVLLSTSTLRKETARDLGTRLAELDLALQGFSHPGENPVLLWDLQQLLELRELLGFIDSTAVSSSVAAVIDDYERNVAPRIGSLRCQVIHGDANPENVLLDERGQRVTAFIDFSDSHNAPLVFDLAIAGAYLRTREDDSLALIAPFVAAYRAVLPLHDGEFDLLFDLVRARLAMTIAILYWRLGAREADDSYREKTLRSESGAIRFLDALDRLGRDGFLARLRQEPGIR